MKSQDDISHMNTYIHTYVRTYIRTSRNQYVPYFFKVGGINREKNLKIFRVGPKKVGSVGFLETRHFFGGGAQALNMQFCIHSQTK